jgi:biopolymer transport protein ExbB/TolQ
MTEIFKKLALVGDVWVLWILLAASVFSIGVIFERWWFFRKNNLNFSWFLDSLTGFLEEGNLSGARNLIEGVNTIESRVAGAGLNNLFKGPASVEEAMTSKLALERSQLDRNLIILGTLGNNAPFVGLFGTVLGIIKAFNDLAVSGSSGVSVVMAGISSALIATAFGILVAIPAVVANNVFQTYLKKKLANTNSVTHLFQVYLKDETVGRLLRAVRTQFEEEVRI